MRSKYVILLLVINYLLIGILGYYFFRRSYLTLNMLRFDPLEESYLRTDSIASGDSLATIWLIGDSRVSHWDQSLLASSEARILNLGIAGQTSAQVLNRLRNCLDRNPAPDLIILEVGINDLKIIGLKENLRRKIEEGCYNNIVSFVNLCLNRKLKLIMVSIISHGNIEPARRLVWNHAVDSALVNINARIKNFCDLNDVIYYDANKILCSNGLIIKKEYQNGFLHLNRSAYDQLSRELLDKVDIESLINKN